MISVIVPVYNEEKTIEELHRKIVETLGRQNDAYEIIFVNDGSTDKTCELAAKLRPLKLISFEKNYGETIALDAGIYEASGEIIVLMDGDLQNDPGDTRFLLQKIKEGCDVVVGWRLTRNDPLSRILFSKFANGLARLVLGLNIHDFGCGLKAYKSDYIKDFRLWGRMQVFLPAIAKARGAKICEAVVSHSPRKIGFSKIKMSDMIKGGIGLLGILPYRYFLKPYRIVRPSYVIKEIKENK